MSYRDCPLKDTELCAGEFSCPTSDLAELSKELKTKTIKTPNGNIELIKHDSFRDNKSDGIEFDPEQVTYKYIKNKSSKEDQVKWIKVVSYRSEGEREWQDCKFDWFIEDGETVADCARRCCSENNFMGVCMDTGEAFQLDLYAESKMQPYYGG